MTRPITADDLLRLRAVGHVAVDRGRIAFTVGWPDAETDENRSELFLLVDGTPQRLGEFHRVTRPRWSPDGTRLLVLAADPDTPAAPAIVTVDDGTVARLDDFTDERIDDVQWIDDGRLAVLTTRGRNDPSNVDPIITTRFDHRFNGRGTTAGREGVVDVVDVTSGAVTPLSPRHVDIGSISVAPDRASVAALARMDPDADLHLGVRPVTLSLDGDAEPVPLTDAPGRWGSVHHLPDGRVLLIGRPELDRLGFSRPYVVDERGDVTVVGPHDRQAAAVIGAPVEPRIVDDGLLVASPHGMTVTIDHYDVRNGGRVTRAAVDGVIGSFDLDGDRIGDAAIVAAVSLPTRPAELWRFPADGDPEVLVALNDDVLAELDLVTPEVVSVESTEGAEIEAMIVRPAASVRPSDGQPGPGLVYVHGGPMSAYTLGFFDEFQLAAADGYTVIAGNPRGSDGYGEAWATSIVHDLGGRDWTDVTALTDHLVALPDVDADRIGIGGGSYGGFMASWAIGHTDRYRAALVERAVTNWETFCGTSDIGGYFAGHYLGADPESDVERLRAASPVTHAASATTPTLILHSEADFRCPIEQAEQLFGILRRRGVDVTFVRFPEENHELSRSGAPLRRVRRFRLVHEFFARHLLDQPSRV